MGHSEGGRKLEILTPLSPGHSVEKMISAGSDEFYFGFFDPAWENEMPYWQGVNRMSGWEAANFPLDSVAHVIGELHALGKNVYVTLNAPFYSNRMMSLVEGYLELLKSAETDGVIVSSPELVRLVRRYGLEATASTMCGIYNTDLAEFYADLGVKRMILPRELSTEEIAAITGRFPGIEFEVFLMRNGCVFSDSNCLTVHNASCGALCSRLRREGRRIYSNSEGFRHRHDIELTEEVYRTEFMKRSCGLCALYRFLKIGISSVKVVGRADELRSLEEDVALVRENIAVAQNCGSEKEFLDRMIFPQDRFRRCRMGFSCYYPEIRF